MDVKRGAFRRLDCEVIVAQTVETAATMRRDADRQRLMSLCVLFCLWHLWHFFSHVSFAQMRQLDVLKQKLSEAQKFIKSQEPNMLKDPDESEIMIGAMCQACIEEAIEDSENDMRQRLKNSTFGQEMPEMSKEYVDLWLAKETLIKQYLGFVFHVMFCFPQPYTCKNP